MRLINKFIFLLACYFVLLGCQKKIDPITQTNILRVPLTNEVSTLDPAESYDTISAFVVYQGYETLYEYHYLKRPYELRPLLAEDMPFVEENGTKYTIKLKKDVFYHPDPSITANRTVKAIDFVNQIKRLAYKPTKSSGWWLIDNKIVGINKFRDAAGESFEKFISTSIKGIQTPNDYTLVIKLTEPNPQFIFTLAMTFTAPIPLESIIYYRNNLENIIVGTGPYKLKKFDKANSIEMVRFEKYHPCQYPIVGEGDRYSYDHGLMKDSGMQVPFLDGINFIIEREPTARWQSFINDTVDLIVVPNDSKNVISQVDDGVKQNANDKKTKVQIAPTMTYWWLAFNMNHPLIGKNLNLRMAIAHAINIDEFITTFTKSIGLRANSIYHPGIPGYDPSHRLPYKYDLALAKQYLEKAGYPNGKGLPPINYDTRGQSSTNLEQANYIKDQLSKIGININIVLNSFPEFLEKSKSGKLEFWEGGWTLDYPDAENILQLLVTKNKSPGPNATMYSNKKFDELFEKLKYSIDEIDKRALMTKMEQMVEQDVPWIMQHYTRSYLLHNARLQNFRFSEIIYNSMKYYKFSAE